METAGLQVRYGVDLSGFTQKVKQAQDRFTKAADKMEKASARLGRAGSVLSAAVTAPLAAIAARSVMAASALEETQSKFNVVFKDLAKDARSWAAQNAKAWGRGQGDIEKYLASLQDTFVPLGFARDQAADMSKVLTKLAVDLASFNNISDEEALQSLQSGIIGNTETLRKFGVIITQTILDQELLNMGIEGGVKAATEAEKAQARLAIVMRSTTDAQGDATRTANSFANRLKNMQARLGDVAETIGGILLPTATKLVNLIANLSEKFAALPSSIQNAAVGMGAFAAAIGPGSLLLAGFAKVIPLMRNFAASMKGLNLATSAVVLKFALIASAVGLLVIAVKSAFDAFEGLRSFVKTAFDNISEYITEVVNNGIDQFNTMASAISDFFGRTFAAIEPVVGPVFEDIASAAAEMYDSIANSEALQDFKTAFMSDLEAVANTTKEQVDKIKGFFGELTAGGGAQEAATPTIGAPAAGGVAGDTQSGGGLSGLIGIEPSSFEQEVNKITLTNKKLADSMSDTKEEITAAGQAIGQSLGQNIGELITGGQTLKQALKNILGSIVDKMIASAVAAIAAGEGIQKAFTGIGAIALATAAGVAATAAFSGMKTAAFADGGLVFGPTMALTGEYPGAGRDPEVIAPLSKLKDYIGDGAGSPTTINVVGKIDGRDIVFSTDRTNRADTRFGI